MFTETICQRLNEKLLKTLGHLEKVKADKTAEVASFNDEIKGTQKRVDVLVKVLQTKDLTLLANVFFDEEVRQLTAP